MTDPNIDPGTSVPDIETVDENEPPLSEEELPSEENIEESEAEEEEEEEG